MPFQLIDLDMFVQLAREDVPDSPLPILRRLTQRVLRDFTAETFCLRENIPTGVIEGRLVTLPLEVTQETEPILEHLPGTALVVQEGGAGVIMEDTPPDQDPQSGRVTDVGDQVWFRDYDYGSNIVPAGGLWERLVVRILPRENDVSHDEINAYLGETADYATFLNVVVHSEDGLSILAYLDGTDVALHEDPDYHAPIGVPFVIEITRGDSETTVSLNSETRLTFVNSPYFPPSDGGWLEIESTRRSEIPNLFEPIIVQVGTYGAEIVPKTEVISPTVVVVPFKTVRHASNVPSPLLRHAANIKQGILARLLAQKGKPWSNPAMAAINRAKYEACKGEVKAEYLRTVGPGGVPQ